jgi:hypothetical protein
LGAITPCPFACHHDISFDDNLTWYRKSHAVKAGVVLQRTQKRQNMPNAANGRLTFDINAPGSTGVNFGDVLVGRPSSATIGTPSATGEFLRTGFPDLSPPSIRRRSPGLSSILSRSVSRLVP